ncbi:hypothetical protein [Geotalea toluenoxydans]|uniref:hypothetical protein n=1 Tax=Geotalea toluenoxydans TaxID=421624 RepID=UPI001FB3F55C|nr:hypothetical protein [Geotalea toluenoxydans]
MKKYRNQRREREVFDDGCSKRIKDVFGRFNIYGNARTKSNFSYRPVGNVGC